jgi:predicted DNA-binding transcriptional regulator YafY
MAKRSDTLETALLALELLKRIPRRRRVSAKELHDQLRSAGFERDLRTIQRLLEVLSGQFDIERDERSRPFGYRWKERAKGLSVPALGEQESLLLTLAEQHLRNLLPANLMRSLEAFFAQARVTMGPSGKAMREREWLQKVRVVSTTQPLLPPTVRKEVFEAVSNALYANRWLAVEYENAAGKKTTADIMPLGLAQQGTRLYLVCRFRGSDNERSLAVHRIRTARVSTLGFERPKDFDLALYDDDGRFGFGEGRRIRLSFCIEKEAGHHLLESPLSTDQKVKELADCYEITATVVDTAQLEWWLRGFGERVERVSKRAVSNVKQGDQK